MRNGDWCKNNCENFKSCGFGGICNRAIKFVRNQTPISPEIVENSYGRKFYHCPSCEREFFTYDNFCSDCGQAICWDGIRIQTSDIVRRKK